jgi:glycosyltransferase involved in cell wall biosynthesis
MNAEIPLTALILTYNEESNIARTLTSLDWVPRILVIDSGSTDGTLAILAAHPSVEVMQRSFDSFADQCNFGLDRITTPWVLSLDADYVISSALAQEISRTIHDPRHGSVAGFSIPFRYCIAGRPLSGTLLPPRTALYRTRAGRYRNEGHGHRLSLHGEVQRLKAPILHDDRKPLARWISSQQRYMTIEAETLNRTPTRELSNADRLRKHTPLAPFAVLLLCLVWKRGLLDGWRGWAYALQRMYAELLLSLMLIEARIQRSPSAPPARVP